MQEVAARSLFSENETFEELPTNSLQYLLISYYIGKVMQSITGDPEERLERLDYAKV